MLKISLMNLGKIVLLNSQSRYNTELFFSFDVHISTIQTNPSMLLDGVGVDCLC